MDLFGKTPRQGAMKGMDRREMWQLLLHHAKRPEHKASQYTVAFLTKED